MKIFVLILLSSILMLADIGKLISVKGDVTINRMGEIIRAKKDSTLQVKDIIISKKQSRAMIEFNDKTLITLGQNSKITLENYVYDTKTPQNSRLEFKFGKGIFRTISGKIGKINYNYFKLKTKTTSIGIRGSDGTTIVDENGNVKHVTNEGNFILTNNSTGKTVFVPEGFTGQSNSKNTQASVTNKVDLAQVKELGLLYKKDMEKENLDNNTTESTPAKEIDENVEPKESKIDHKILKHKKEYKKIVVSHNYKYVSREEDINLELHYAIKAIQPFVSLNYNMYAFDKVFNIENKKLGLNAGYLFNNDTKVQVSFFRDTVDVPDARYKVELIDIKYGYSFNNFGVRKGFTLDAGFVRNRIDILTQKEVEVVDKDTGDVTKEMVGVTDKSKSWYLSASLGYEHKVSKNYIFEIKQNINLLKLSSNSDVKEVQNTIISIKYLFD